jgi:D-amino-acid oxidase
VNSPFLLNPWYESLFDDFRELSKDELPTGIASGCEFGSVCINTVVYLSWLVGQCRANGVVFRRGELKHIAEASGWSHAGSKADFIINASALGSLRLGGVTDQKMYPVRGQTVLVRNESPYMVAKSRHDDGEEMCYVMTRAAGGGTILGGTYQRGHWESQPDPNMAFRIMSRAVEVVPELADGKGIAGLQVIRHNVGLRPARDGGVRVEREKVGGVWIVHNYGHGGSGYQSSYGCAEGVVELVNEVLNRSKL